MTLSSTSHSNNQLQLVGVKRESGGSDSADFEEYKDGTKRRKLSDK